MCVMSVIMDYGRYIPDEQWTLPAIKEFRVLIDEAQKFDEVADQPHCEKPEKTAWMEKLDEIEERLRNLEAKAFRDK